MKYLENNDDKRLMSRTSTRKQYGVNLVCEIILVQMHFYDD
jgi:hypothetical protein